MLAMNIHLDGAGVWPDAEEGKNFFPQLPIEIARMPRGMQSGKSSVGIRITLPDGKVVITQTSMRLFQMAAKAFAERDRMEGVPE